MGIRILSGGSTCNKCCTPTTSVESKKNINPNPNPFKFNITESFDINGHCILVVNYIGCTTYDGNKVLVFKGNSKEYLNNAELDPHFLNDNNLVARFRPTLEGIEHAKLFCSSTPLYYK